MMKLEDFAAERVGMDWKTFETGALCDVMISTIFTEGAVLFSINGTSVSPCVDELAEVFLAAEVGNGVFFLSLAMMMEDKS